MMIDMYAMMIAGMLNGSFKLQNIQLIQTQSLVPTLIQRLQLNHLPNKRLTIVHKAPSYNHLRILVHIRLLRLRISHSSYVKNYDQRLVPSR